MGTAATTSGGAAGNPIITGFLPRSKYIARLSDYLRLGAEPQGLFFVAAVAGGGGQQFSSDLADNGAGESVARSSQGRARLGVRLKRALIQSGA